MGVCLCRAAAPLASCLSLRLPLADLRWFCSRIQNPAAMLQSLATVVVLFASTFLPLSTGKPAALKNQSELVQTPGLFDSPLEQNRGRGLPLVEDDAAGKTNIVDNHIISY